MATMAMVMVEETYSMSGEHFTESEAKYLVADMYHTENGRKYSGEKFKDADCKAENKVVEYLGEY